MEIDSDPAAMIVIAKPPPRRRQERRKAAIACPMIVSAQKPGARPYASLGAKAAPDPEAEGPRAFFARAIRPPVHE